MKKIYFKLVRDKIPEIIKNEDKKVKFSIIPKEQRMSFLERKLYEEIKELFRSKNKEEYIEELSDVYEVLLSIEKINNIDHSEVIMFQDEKHMNKGGFYNFILLEEVEE